MPLVVTEIFASIAGETSWAGLPCAFVRLSGCNLNCSWCDTEYAKLPGAIMTVAAIISALKKFRAKLVCVTGGEPLMQEETPALVRKLIGAGKTVLVETNGSYSIGKIPKAAHRIVDVKTPGSGAHKSFFKNNLDLLTPRDELKFVVGGVADFMWAESFVKKHKLDGRCELLISPAIPKKANAGEEKKIAQAIAEKIVSSGINFRYNIQLHKIIWGRETKGV